jgi:hypothetical protein
MNVKNMNNRQRILKSLQSDDFTKIINKGKWFEENAAVYAKEIGENIFLLFVILKDKEPDDIQAFIAHFDCFESIGTKEPIQIMFYLSINENEDLHYFEKYLTSCE